MVVLGSSVYIKEERKILTMRLIKVKILESEYKQWKERKGKDNLYPFTSYKIEQSLKLKSEDHK